MIFSHKMFWSAKGVFINTLGWGWAKWRGPKKFWVTRRGDQNVFRSKGEVKKFGQIESVMKNKMHNLLLKLTGCSLRLDLYFKIFPGPSAGPDLHLTLKIPPLAQPSGTLGICLESQVCRLCRFIEGGCRIYPLLCLTRGIMACVSSLPSNGIHS